MPETRDEAADLCARCSRPRRQHYAVNYSDGQLVSGETLICPTAVFLWQPGLAQRVPSPRPEQEP
jgi:hypothetical protein